MKNLLNFDNITIIEKNILVDQEHMNDYMIGCNAISRLYGDFEYYFDKSWTLLFLKKDNHILVFKSQLSYQPKN